MRNFLITKKTYNCGKLAGFEILGMVQGDNFPAYDKETAKKAIRLWIRGRNGSTGKMPHQGILKIEYWVKKSVFVTGFLFCRSGP